MNGTWEPGCRCPECWIRRVTDWHRSLASDLPSRRRGAGLDVARFAGCAILGAVALFFCVAIALLAWRATG